MNRKQIAHLALCLLASLALALACSKSGHKENTGAATKEAAEPSQHAPEQPANAEGHEGCDHGEHVAHEEHAEHEGHEEAEGGCGCAHDEEPDEHEGHDHGAHEGHDHPELPIDQLAKPECEHDMPMIQCDECRYELGVVRVPVEIEERLLDSAVATAIHSGAEPVVLRCETDVDALRATSVVPLSAGRVESVLKGLGDKVIKGDVLAVLHSNEFAATKMAHQQVHQALALAEARFERLETFQANLKSLLAGLETLDEGPPDYESLAKLHVGKAKADLLQAANGYLRAYDERQRDMRVIKDARRLVRKLKRGDKFQQDQYKIGKWKALLLEAHADLTFARKALARIEKLKKKGLASASELDKSHRDSQGANARFSAALEQVALEADRIEARGIEELRNARARLQGTVEERVLALEIQRLEASQSVENRKNETAVSHQTLRTYGLTDQELEGLTDREHVDFARLEVRAPAPGVILEQHVSVGRSVQGADVLFKLADMSRLWVWCDVYEKDISRIESSSFPLQVKVLTDAYPGQEFAGQLDYLSAFSDEHSRTVKARVITDSRGGLLKPKMFATGHVLLDETTSGVLVPEGAVVSDEGSSFVFVRWKDHFWVKRTVELGPRMAKGQLIRSGIEDGDEVATTGSFFLKSDVLREKMGAGCAH